MMRPIGSPIGVGPFLRVLVYTALLFALGDFLLYRHSAADPWDVFGEFGRIETAQVVLMVLALLLAGFTMLRKPASRPLSILLVGFLAALLVREHNNYFKDHVGDNVWQAIVGVVVVVTFLIAFRWRRNLGAALYVLISAPAFGWLSAGVMVALFGQLTDEPELWEFLLGEGYPYAARRAVEECFELVAHFLFLVGIFEYYLALPGPEDSPSSA